MGVLELTQLKDQTHRGLSDGPLYAAVEETFDIRVRALEGSEGPCGGQKRNELNRLAKLPNETLRAADKGPCLDSDSIAVHKVKLAIDAKSRNRI